MNTEDLPLPETLDELYAEEGKLREIINTIDLQMAQMKVDPRPFQNNTWHSKALAKKTHEMKRLIRIQTAIKLSVGVTATEREEYWKSRYSAMAQWAYDHCDSTEEYNMFVRGLFT